MKQVINRIARRGLIITLALIATMIFFASLPAHESAVQPRREGHALWAHPPDAGRNAESVRREKLWPTLEAAFKQ